MTEQEQYNADRNTEREVAKFLDTKMYLIQELGLDVKRIDDKKEQVSGVDAILTCERLGIKDVAVDEKCASAYWNKKINTFSFELSFLKFGNLRQGWLVNENLKTEYYNICWLNATKKWFKCEDITWFEMALVSKKKILDYLALQNLTIEHLKADDEWIRKHKTEKGAIGIGKYDGCFFYYSPQLHEKPINILIKKEKILELSDFHTEITK